MREREFPWRATRQVAAVAAKLGLKAVLVSPHFLFKREKFHDQRFVVPNSMNLAIFTLYLLMFKVHCF